MPELTLAYRCCDRKLPLYIKHSEVEGIAVLARQQLVDANTDAISLAVLRGISSLKINGIRESLPPVQENPFADMEDGGKTMAGMRATYNGHTHSGTDSHGDGFTTAVPNQQE